MVKCGSTLIDLTTGEMEAGQVMSSMSIQALKEPRGFIRFIQVVLAIFAFATTCSVSTSVTFSVSCNHTAAAQTTVPFAYPFKLVDVGFNIPKCDGSDQPLTFVAGSGASSQFYVFIGVMAFLYSLAAIILYVFFDELYRKKNSIVVADFIITIVFTVMWLISSSAWAQGVSDVKYHTDPTTGIFPHAEACRTGSNNTCMADTLGNFASLNVSIIFGFLNMLVWGGNVWFLYKETPWFKGNQSSGDYTPDKSMPQGPVGGSPTSPNIP